MSKSGGVFQIDDVTRTMSKGAGAPGVPPMHPSSDPPPGWLATGLYQVYQFLLCIHSETADHHNLHR